MQPDELRQICLKNILGGHLLATQDGLPDTHEYCISRSQGRLSVWPDIGEPLVSSTTWAGDVSENSGCSWNRSNKGCSLTILR